MKCSEIQEMLSAYYDNELSAELRATVDKHIGPCAECSAELAHFENLGSLAAGLEQPETPASVWTAVKQGLDQQNIGQGQSEKVTPATITNGGYSGKRFFQYAAAIAATALFGFVGWTLWHSDHEHQEMVEAMEQVASEINSDNVTTLLLNKFGGREVSFEDAITEVGFRPVASKGLPEGYSVEGIQVLDMPCCKCTQTACRRPDKSRLFIYEHDNEDTGWFEHRNKRQSECCGKKCEIVQLDDQLAATWQKDNRHVTLLGVRDVEELELLVRQFEENL